MKIAIKFITGLALLLLVTTAFATIPTQSIKVTVSTDTTLNTMSWNVTNLTSDTSGFKLVRLDWLYPIYDVSNVAPSSPWLFAKFQIAPDEAAGLLVTNAVSWATTVANGLGFNQSMSFTIHSVPPVVLQQPMPLHLVWQRSLADTPPGEPSDMSTGLTPEPSSLIAICAGLLGVGGLLVRRKR